MEEEKKEQQIDKECQELVDIAYKRGYNLGFQQSKRIKRRLLKVKAFIKEAWALLSQMKE